MGSSGGVPDFDAERSVLSAVLPAYELLGTIGRGAFAVVYAARHVGLDREVAIKRLSPQLLDDADARARFGAEARLLASLDHPHVVRVYDYVESETVCALVMERMHGGTLTDRLRMARPRAITSCAFAVAALQGLQHAHQHGVLHRDVKPDNLLFGPGQLLKVADFGIAKMLGPGAAGLTGTVGALGTPAYMAPEQARRASRPLGPATDVWGMAAVLYECVAGQPPFPHDQVELTALLLERVTSDPRPLRELAPQLPAAVEAVIMGALDRDPARRFQSAAAFAEALETSVEQGFGAGALEQTGVPIHRATRPPAAPTVAPGELTTAAAPDAILRRRRAHRAIPAAALGAVLIATAAIAVVLASAGGGGGLADLPARPPGWPAKLAIGFQDSVAGPAGVAQRTGVGGIAYANYGVGDAAAGKDWSHDHSQPPPQQYAADAQRHDLMPYLTYYEVRSLGRNGKDDADTVQLREILVDRRLMRIYWSNVRAFLMRLGATRGPVALSVEPSIWALLEQSLGFSGDQPNDVPAVVGSAGIPELAGLSDNLPGFSDAWRLLRDRYAPKTLLGATLDFYGTNIDIHRETPSQATVLSAASRQARYFLALSSTGLDYDFASWEVAFNEAGAGPTPAYTDTQKQDAVTWLTQFASIAKVPLMLEAVPEGNTVMKTIDDKPYHYHDSWAQWLMGDPGMTPLRRLRDAGLIGIQFGVGSGNTETCPCDAAHDGVTNGGRQGLLSHSADDDGGYLAARLAAYRRMGGLALPAARSGTQS